MIDIYYVYMCKNNASVHYYYSSARGGGRLFPSKVEFGSLTFHFMSYLVHVLPDKTIFVMFLKFLMVFLISFSG